MTLAGMRLTVLALLLLLVVRLGAVAGHAPTATAADHCDEPSTRQPRSAHCRKPAATVRKRSFPGLRPLTHRPGNGLPPYATFTSTGFGMVAADFGIVTFSTPSLK